MFAWWFWIACTPPTDVPDPLDGFCGSPELLQAPAPIDSALGPLAPVDLKTVDVRATLFEDGVDIVADAIFVVGPHGARPVLELGPDPELAQLDGLPVAVDRVSVSEPSREVVALPELDACSEHRLHVEYSLDLDWMSGDGQVRLEAHPDGLFWSAGLEDNQSGRFLSMWMPSNLLFDRFDVSLDIDPSALGGSHEVLTTGDVDGWRLGWTETLAHSPFWVVSPVDETEHASRTFDVDGEAFTVEVRALRSDGVDLDEALDRAEAAVTAFSEWFGPYGHGDRYLMWIRPGQGGSMEYDGATQTEMGAIEHEILHSWFARGAAPMADLHGWADEAITSWVTDLFPFRAVEMDYDTVPQALRVGRDEWAGAELSYEQYVFGSSIFADVADRHGVDETVDALAAFHEEYSARSYRSSDLEAHLTCWFDDDAVRRAFRHRAYGLEGPPAPRPVHWCR